MNPTRALVEAAARLDSDRLLGRKNDGIVAVGTSELLECQLLWASSLAGISCLPGSSFWSVREFLSVRADTLLAAHGLIDERSEEAADDDPTDHDHDRQLGDRCGTHRVAALGDEVQAFLGIA